MDESVDRSLGLRPFGALAFTPLRDQALELQAADALERRAAAIQEWPFDEGILRAIAAIVTSVTAAIFARLVLSQLGL